jgi:hypothetical protein
LIERRQKTSRRTNTASSATTVSNDDGFETMVDVSPAWLAKPRRGL